MDQKLKILLLEVWDAARKTKSEFNPKKHKTHETPFYKNLDEWLDTQNNSITSFLKNIEELKKRIYLLTIDEEDKID